MTPSSTPQVSQQPSTNVTTSALIMPKRPAGEEFNASHIGQGALAGAMLMCVTTLVALRLRRREATRLH